MQHLYDPPAARTPVIHPVRTLAALLPLAGGLALLPLQPLRAQALFGAAELDQSKFVIVAAPIGDGSRAQLNIYEQRTDVRPCFAVQGSNPAVVEPLLSSFDFTGICNRFIDGNGYSVRIGGSDLGTVYRLSVVKEKGDTLLLALPTKAGVGPEMVVARSGGQSNGFLQLLPEPLVLRIALPQPLLRHPRLRLRPRLPVVPVRQVRVRAITRLAADLIRSAICLEADIRLEIYLDSIEECVEIEI